VPAPHREAFKKMAVKLCNAKEKTEILTIRERAQGVALRL
jgi:hypothetical protein